MKIPEHPTLVRRMRDARLKQLVARCPVVGASLVEIATTCGNPDCRCRKDRKNRHVGLYLTRKVKGKTKTVYVPQELAEEVRKWIREHRRLKELTREISLLSIAQVATHVKTQRRRAGRP